MVTASYTTDGTLSKQCIRWSIPVSTMITSIVSPITDTFTRATCSNESQIGLKRKRAVSFHPSPDSVSLIYPQIGVSISRPDLCRRKSSPPMPSGEHNAAARSRVRAKSERQRRRQSMAAIRRCNELGIDESLHDEATRQINTRGRILRSTTSSSVRPPMSVQSNMAECEYSHQQRPSINAISEVKSKQKIPKTPPLRLKSSSTIETPTEGLFEGFISTEKDGTSHAPSNKRYRKPLLDALLISPKTKFPNPTSGLVTREHATAFTNSIPVLRKKKDLYPPPVSSSYYLWHLFIDGKGPITFTAVDGRRGSGWTIDTSNLGRSRTHKALDSIDGVYHSDMYGKRKYNRESGFWAWASTMTDVHG